jgi:hypothetical protein
VTDRSAISSSSASLVIKDIAETYTPLLEGHPNGLLKDVSFGI